MSLISSSTVGTSSTLMPAVGSSNMKTFGSSAMRSATSSLRWSPCERAFGASVPLVGEANRLEHLLGPLDQIAPGVPDREHRPAGARTALHREPDVFQGGELRKQIGELEGAPQSPVVRAEADRPPDVVPIDEDRSGAGLHLSGNQVEIGRLAGAVRADDRRERARLEPARDIIDRDMAAEANRQPACFEGGRIGL